MAPDINTTAAVKRLSRAVTFAAGAPVIWSPKNSCHPTSGGVNARRGPALANESRLNRPNPVESGCHYHDYEVKVV